MPDPRDLLESKISRWVRDHRAPNEPPFDADAAWTRFSRERDLHARTLHGRRRMAAAWSAAAAFILAAVLTYRQLGPGSHALVERVVANGERATITLDDGTKVTLNGGSRFRYPKSGAGDRDVFLEGEGFFEVTHDPKRAFRVHAASSVIEDVGTRFNVRAYPAHPGVEVTVTEGTVALAREGASALKLTLNAGDVGILDSTGVPLKSARTPVKNVGWTTGALVFESVPLRDAALELEHRFGAHIVVADDSLARRPVVATFHGETIGQVLDAISLALGARYEHKDSTYTLMPRAK